MFNLFCLSGKKIFVTGATSSLGQDISYSCSKMDAELFITGRNQDRLKQTYEGLYSGMHLMHSCDLINAIEVDGLLKKMEPMDGIVLSANFLKASPIYFPSEVLLNQTTEINYTAQITLIQKLLHRNLIRNGGSIIFITSVAAHSGNEDMGYFSSQKAALTGFMRSMVIEVSKKKIRVNCVAPSLMDAPLMEGAPDVRSNLPNYYPLGLGAPSDVSNAVIYLLSDASKWVTGTSLILNGGRY